MGEGLSPRQDDTKSRNYDGNSGHGVTGGKVLPQKRPRLVSLLVMTSAAGHGRGKDRVGADTDRALK